MESKMEGLRQPDKLLLSENAEANWRRFKQNFEIYLEASDLKTASDSRKIALLLNIAGSEALEVFNTFEDKCKSTFASVINAFEAHCIPRKNMVVNSYKFFNMRQNELTFDQFLTELRTQAKFCEFKEEDRLVRDVIVIGVKDINLQERLLREPDLTLDQTIKICRAAEAGKIQVEKMREKEINLVATTSKRFQGCNWCGRKHSRGQCPAYGKKCSECQRFNHFAKMCKSKVFNKKKTVNKVFNVDKEEDELSSEDNFNVDSLLDINVIGKVQWTQNIIINDISVVFKLDTGADCNTLSANIFSKINKDNKFELKESQTVLVVYNGEKIKPLGCVELDCLVKNCKYLIKFNVVDLPVQPVLGLKECVKLNLIEKIEAITEVGKNTKVQKESFIEDNKDLFTGLGTIGKYKIQIKEGAVPVIKPIRRVPQSVKDRLKETLDRYEKGDIIEKVEGPTAWCSNLVIVEKPDKSLRLCLDPQQLNKHIERETYLIPSPEEIYNNLAGKSYFTVLDLKDGFFQIVLDDEDKLCTFGSPFGRYRFKRMPFGISSAPEIMQKINNNIFGDIPGVSIYFDDIIVAGENEEEHDRILKMVMDRAKKCNVKFNSKKLQYKLEEVKYVGLIVSKRGIRVDDDMVRSIVELKTPNNVKELQKFLGMCNYLSKFIPQYTKTAGPLRNLLKKEVPWQWGLSQEKSFQELKKKLTCSPTLAILKNKGVVTLQTDSSNSGLGACLLQDGKPIAFYSRSYTECQKRWAPIEKELYAICASIDKYHQFVYGRKIVVETDHKPLVAIVNKDINKISSRLQRMILRLLKYDIEIKYIPGNKMYIADYLSRNYLTDNAKDDLTLQEIVHSFDCELAVSERRMMQLSSETVNDKDLSQVIQWYKIGWPKNSNSLNKELKKLYKLRDKLSIKDNIVYFNNKIVIPKSMRTEMLISLHTGHVGIIKCKKRARGIMYWPGISGDIDIFISKCKACEKYRPDNVKEPLMSHDIPDLPFYKIGMDICYYKGKDYLVVIDYYSKWIEVKKLPNKNSEEIIKKLKIIFASQGIPNIIVSDNMPFGSKNFKEFAKNFDIELITSSPRYPQSNGMSEKAVGIVKNIMRKCEETGSDFSLALLNYRTTPLAQLDYSPSELLMSRSLRTTLPCTKETLKPRLLKNVEKKIIEVKNKTKKYYDKSSKVRQPFNVGSNVVFQNKPDKVWHSGQIVGKASGPRSYLIKREDGTQVKRNKKHVSLSQNKFIMKNDYSDLSVGTDTQTTLRASMSTDTSENRPGPPTSPNCVTRSGRVVRRPAHLNDYY